MLVAPMLVAPMLVTPMLVASIVGLPPMQSRFDSQLGSDSCTVRGRAFPLVSSWMYPLSSGEVNRQLTWSDLPVTPSNPTGNPSCENYEMGCMCKMGDFKEPMVIASSKD